MVCVRDWCVTQGSNPTGKNQHWTMLCLVSCATFCISILGNSDFSNFAMSKIFTHFLGMNLEFDFRVDLRHGNNGLMQSLQREHFLQNSFLINCLQNEINFTLLFHFSMVLIHYQRKWNNLELFLNKCLLLKTLKTKDYFTPAIHKAFSEREGKKKTKPLNYSFEKCNILQPKSICPFGHSWRDNQQLRGHLRRSDKNSY